jgi:hypothetical protein
VGREGPVCGVTGVYGLGMDKVIKGRIVPLIAGVLELWNGCVTLMGLASSVDSL